MTIKEKHIFGWRVIDKSPAITHCVVCVAPHTSNWDFVIGHLACYALNRKMSFLMKDDWFKFPLGPIFRRIGGIAVNRSESSGMTESLVRELKQNKNMTLVITPEGTRSANTDWKTGFYRIAQNAGVPLLLASLDYENKEVCISEAFNMTNDIDADIKTIKQYFTQYKGKKPENFAI